MRRAARVDANQEQIVIALRAAGASVQVISAVGLGVPDLLVGFRDRNWLVECKNPDQAPNKRRLTSDQKDWHAQWRGSVSVALSADEALRAIGAIR